MTDLLAHLGRILTACSAHVPPSAIIISDGPALRPFLVGANIGNGELGLIDGRIAIWWPIWRPVA